MHKSCSSKVSFRLQSISFRSSRFFHLGEHKYKQEHQQHPHSTSLFTLKAIRKAVASDPHHLAPARPERHRSYRPALGAPRVGPTSSYSVFIVSLRHGTIFLATRHFFTIFLFLLSFFRSLTPSWPRNITSTSTGNLNPALACTSGIPD